MDGELYDTCLESPPLIFAVDVLLNLLLYARSTRIVSVKSIRAETRWGILPIMAFFRLQLYKRVGISQVEVNKRVGKSVI